MHSLLIFDPKLQNIWWVVLAVNHHLKLMLKLEQWTWPRSK
jgi:hypothetical protein